MNDTAAAPRTIYLKDYTPPDYRVDKVELRFELDPADTVVTARLALRAAYDRADGVRPLRLDGEQLELLAIAIDGNPLHEESDYTSDATGLTVRTPPERFVLETVSRIHPDRNTALEGLYISSGNFCTQCEAEGFRKITWYPDRPDVMAPFTTTVVADAAVYPVLLSNGNRVGGGTLDGGRHYAVWEDPFPKPCYLFALVAGDLARVSDTFTTRSGRPVALEIHVQHGNEDKTAHAMRSLKRAMRWDEEVYGREYDLDVYMIVAVDDFNMGAMENKGLNVFNSRFVLARPDTATDFDYVHVEAVIAHEYFHNWSGNRVTCRDWFQLSLKEGFTVFRDQQFSADMNSAAVQRIETVASLRARQFAEDAGPMAHPVRPESYVEINNFYTATVYEKGAEVVRMLHTLLGPEGFRRGTDLYFARHDGQAVTTDDFVKAQEEANGVDLSDFKRWYRQAGTPVLAASGHYDPAGRRYTLELAQSCPPTPGQSDKEPFVIPLQLGLLDGAGRDLPLRLEGEAAPAGTSRVLALSAPRQSFTFLDVPEPPVPSLLRGFSAPLKLRFDYSDEDLAFLMGHDSDPFNRWDAAQQLGVRVVLRQIERLARGETPVLEEGLAAAFGNTLKDPDLDPALVAEALTLPSESYLAECQAVVDPLAIHRVREALRHGLGEAHHGALLHRWRELDDRGPYRPEAADIGRRQLRNVALGYLVRVGSGQARQMAAEQVRRAASMTDVMAGLGHLTDTGAPEAEELLEAFYRQWRHESLVLDKWFALQAGSPAPGASARVRRLVEHPDFTLRNPNRARSVIATFGMRNSAGFHAEDGDGYVFLADQVLALNVLNPQVAARLVEPLIRWRRYAPARGERMRAQLERIMGSAGLSKDLYEVVGKALG